MKKLLIFLPLQIMAMEQADVVVLIAPEPRHDTMITNDDIKRWATMELDARDVGFTAQIKALSDKLDEHVKDNGSAHTKTRVALAATIVTTIGGVASTLITYFATKK